MGNPVRINTARAGKESIDSLESISVSEALDARGHAVIPRLLDRATCEQVRAWFDDEVRFRSTIDMARYRFGAGRYSYFSYPLPKIVADLRMRLYAFLAPIANRWADTLGEPRFPNRHGELVDACRTAGQLRPTPLVLRYRAGDYNCLHQDLYGPMVFPLQVVILLSAPGDEFTGGELVLAEQRPRAQTRAHVVALNQGDAAVIASHHFPRPGKQRPYRAVLKHGVSEIRTGERFALGIIFHDAL